MQIRPIFVTGLVTGLVTGQLLIAAALPAAAATYNLVEGESPPTCSDGSVTPAECQVIEDGRPKLFGSVDVTGSITLADGVERVDRSNTNAITAWDITMTYLPSADDEAFVAPEDRVFSFGKGAATLTFLGGAFLSVDKESLVANLSAVGDAIEFRAPAQVDWSYLTYGFGSQTQAVDFFVNGVSYVTPPAMFRSESGVGPVAVAIVPVPATMAMMMAALLGLTALRCWRRTA